MRAYLSGRVLHSERSMLVLEVAGGGCAASSNSTYSHTGLVGSRQFDVRPASYSAFSVVKPRCGLHRLRCARRAAAISVCPAGFITVAAAMRVILYRRLARPSHLSCCSPRLRDRWRSMVAQATISIMRWSRTGMTRCPSLTQQSQRQDE